MTPLKVHPDRALPADPGTRALACEIYASSRHLLSGTPGRYWLEHELVEVFGIDVTPSAQTADPIYDRIAARIAEPDFRPMALLDRFRIERPTPRGCRRPRRPGSTPPDRPGRSPPPRRRPSRDT